MTAVKICGLREAEHALAAAEAGADMLGFILAPSRRQVTPAQVREIRLALEAAGRRPELVGVFVNAGPDEILAAADEAGLDTVQLSGDEPPELLGPLEGRRVIKTVRLAGDPTEARWLAPGPHQGRARLHVDAHVAGSYGGSGVTADWGRAADLADRLPILLAGGLTPANVGDAVRAVSPWGVDVSSGVETGGVKDSEKIRAFVAAARAARRA